jgi:Type II secretion system (T2SS), protein M subtype b
VTLTLSPLGQRTLALTLAALALALIWFLIAAPIYASVAIHEERVSMLSANADVRSLTFAAAAPSVGIAELQATLNRIFTEAGATVSMSQALPEVAGDGLTKIAVQATIETDIKSLVAALHAVGASRPLLTVEMMAAKEPDGEWVSLTRVTTPNKLIVDLVVSAQLRSM